MELIKSTVKETTFNSFTTKCKQISTPQIHLQKGETTQFKQNKNEKLSKPKHLRALSFISIALAFFGLPIGLLHLLGDEDAGLIELVNVGKVVILGQVNSQSCP
ncbi:unnamed protein product [Cuscuta epithymum]|uniref:Uncharacterized protein n=1 Tax=Cuscuta epithymum TaxID=186058 RepID=A0AAV0GAK6_9ASTE|nr:unnamed protein product [Cuscuta epithymum]